MRVVALLLLLAAETSDAQLSTIKPGERVRVSTTRETLIGRLMAPIGDTVRIAVTALAVRRDSAGAMEMVSIPLSIVDRLDVAQRRKFGPSIWRGITIGLMATLGFTLACGAEYSDDAEGGECTLIGVLLTPFVAGLGAILGLIIGADGWRRVL